MGPWSHGEWGRGTGEKLGSISFHARTAEFYREKIELPFFRHFLNLVPFDREKNFVEGLRACRAVLRKGEPVLIFPEGTRSPEGRLQPFKVGLGILALELNAPVVPARIRGTFEPGQTRRLEVSVEGLVGRFIEKKLTLDWAS